jgi:hypothetical protein
MWPGPEDDCAVSPEAMDLTSRLLAFEPSDRLGFNGADEIKQHPWFAPINWETLRNQPAVMVPQTDDIFDTSYFSGMFIKVDIINLIQILTLNVFLFISSSTRNVPSGF